MMAYATWLDYMALATSLWHYNVKFIDIMRIACSVVDNSYWYLRAWAVNSKLANDSNNKCFIVPEVIEKEKLVITYIKSIIPE